MLSMTIRYATAADTTALDRLAQLDSSEIPAAPQTAPAHPAQTEPPAAPKIVAEADGRLIAAVSTRDGAAIADPFERPADTVAVLRRRARRPDTSVRLRRLATLRPAH